MGNVRYPQMKKSAVLSPKKREQMMLLSSYKAFMLAAFGVLSDAYDWPEEDLIQFKEYMDELTQMMEGGIEDWRTMAKNIEETIGVKIV